MEGPAAHHVDQHDRDLGRAPRGRCFDHQRHARAGRDRHGRRAAVGRAKRHIDRGKFVLAQHQPPAELDEMRRQPFDQIGRGRDRIAADKSHAAAQRAERERLIAADQPACRWFRRVEPQIERQAKRRLRRPHAAPLAFAAISSSPLPRKFRRSLPARRSSPSPMSAQPRRPQTCSHACRAGRAQAWSPSDRSSPAGPRAPSTWR